MWQFFIEHRRVTYVLAVALALIGLISANAMPKESSPEVNVPIAVISTILPGASAIEVEELVTKPIEDQLGGLSDIDAMDSTSSDGVSLITVQFVVGSDIDDLMNDVKERVDRAKSELPDDATDPSVQRVSFNDVPFYTFALSGDLPLAELTEIANDVAEELRGVQSVATVNVIGGQERQIHVLVDDARLSQFGLSLDGVTSAIGAADANIPVGSVESGGAIYNVNFSGSVDSVEELSLLPVGERNGAVIYLRDVATVVDGYAQASSISRLSQNGEASETSVSIALYKVAGGDIVRTRDAVVSELESLDGRVIPQGVSRYVVEDTAEMIRTDLANLISNGLQTSALVMVLLFVFLGWREALLAGLSIPLTFLMTFFGLLNLDLTINFLTLFSLILALGILVDAAIVVTEGLHGNLAKGLSPAEAAKATVEEFKLPLISGTLTTIFAFIPMLLTSGIIGEFIKSIPITITVVLCSSIFVALGIVPTFGMRFLRKQEKQSNFHVKVDQTFDGIRDRYRSILRFLLADAKARRRFFAVTVAAFVLAFALPVTGLLSVNMFPASDEDVMYVDITMPVGTPLATTDEVVTAFESVVVSQPDVKSYLVTVGAQTSAGSLGGGGSQNGHVAQFTVQLNEERKTSSVEIVEALNAAYPEYADADVSFYQTSSGPPSAAPVVISISGDDLNELERLALDVERTVAGIEGTRDVASTVKETNGEFVLTVDRDAVQRYGASPARVAMLLRSAVFGTDATSIRLLGEDVDVSVKYAFGAESVVGSPNIIDLAALESLNVQTATGTVPLGELVETSLANSRATIEHVDGDRIVKVTSNVDTGVSTTEIFAEVQKALDALELPAGYSAKVGGENEDIAESFTDMFRAMFLAIFLIAGLLVWQFKSYRQPFIVLSSIPLGLIGVFFGLALTGQTLSFPGLIGVVALAGIVVNNGIILIDRINESRRKGVEMQEAIIEACDTRLRPIFLTTITTVVGIFPLTISDPTWGPLGFTIIFGLTFSTVLTLGTVPLLYARFAEKVVE